MKKLSTWQVALLLLMVSACKSAEVEKEWCVPKRFLAPSNFVSGKNQDPNYDEPEEGGGPTLFFPAEYLSDRVSGYHAEIDSTSGGVLKQPIHVSISSETFRPTGFDSSQAWKLTEAVPLYSNSSKTEFGWNVFAENGSGEYTFWGQCYDDFEGGFTCMRTLAAGDDYLTYNVEEVNAHLYEDIDKFLTTEVSEWRCK